MKHELIFVVMCLIKHTLDFHFQNLFKFTVVMTMFLQLVYRCCFFVVCFCNLYLIYHVSSYMLFTASVSKRLLPYQAIILYMSDDSMVVYLSPSRGVQARTQEF